MTYINQIVPVLMPVLVHVSYVPCASSTRDGGGGDGDVSLILVLTAVRGLTSLTEIFV